jgi:hypothetical protein
MESFLKTKVPEPPHLNRAQIQRYDPSENFPIDKIRDFGDSFSRHRQLTPQQFEYGHAVTVEATVGLPRRLTALYVRSTAQLAMGKVYYFFDEKPHKLHFAMDILSTHHAVAPALHLTEWNRIMNLNYACRCAQY